jgi:hypothetical protein
MWKMQPKCVITPHERCYKKCQTDKSRWSWRGNSQDVVEGDVVITIKRSRGQLVSQADESLSGDKVEVLEVPRDKS